MAYVMYITSIMRNKAAPMSGMRKTAINRLTTSAADTTKTNSLVALESVLIPSPFSHDFHLGEGNLTELQNPIWATIDEPLFSMHPLHLLPHDVKGSAEAFHVHCWLLLLFELAHTITPSFP